MNKSMNKHPFPHPVENYCGKHSSFSHRGGYKKHDKKVIFSKSILTQDIDSHTVIIGGGVEGGIGARARQILKIACRRYHGAVVAAQ